MDDPFRTYEQVDDLISKNDHKFKFDCTSDDSKAIIAAFSTKKNVAYAVGGEEAWGWGYTSDNIFSSKFEDKWVDFLVGRNPNANESANTEGQTGNGLSSLQEEVLDGQVAEETNPKATKIAKTDGRNDVSSLQEIAIRAIIKEGKLPVDALLELASPAPFGKGNKTVFDKEVRNAFEIKADRIPDDLFNHKWPGNNDRGITRSIETAMKWNKDATWTYKLYKMHIYGPGGFFLPHTDTLHAANHIATAIVSLPAEFEGGELVVTHQEQVSTFDLSNGTAQKTKYCAFFTDCTHEVKEVTSGYRVVLQYDIYEEVKETQTCNKSSDKIIEDCWQGYYHGVPCEKEFYNNRSNGSQDPAELAVLDYFTKQNLGKTESVALLLQHRYPLGSLGAKILKGSDAMVYDMFVSGGRWNCTLQGLMLTASTDWEGTYEDVLQIVPVALTSTGDIYHDSQYPFQKTYLMMYHKSRKAPGQLLRNDRFAEFMGNECQEGKLVYYACCLILCPATVKSSLEEAKGEPTCAA